MKRIDTDSVPGREYSRFATRHDAYAVQDGYLIPCTVTDISANGARLSFDPIAISSFRGRRCTLQIDGIGSYPAEVRWRDRFEMGLSFCISPSQAASLAALLEARAVSSGG